MYQLDLSLAYGASEDEAKNFSFTDQDEASTATESYFLHLTTSNTDLTVTNWTSIRYAIVQNQGSVSIEFTFTSTLGGATGAKTLTIRAGESVVIPSVDKTATFRLAAASSTCHCMVRIVGVR